ncbi:MAG: arsenate reductase family protein [Candidatus Poseidoniaceae archaeon]
MASVYDWCGRPKRPMYVTIHHRTMTTLYHNPRCSKSRQALAMCEASDASVHIHLYLIEPLTKEVLASMISRLDGPLSSLIRTKDPKFKLVDSSKLHVDNADSVADFLSLHGHLMERPLLDNGKVSRIGRPVERLEPLL